MEQSLACDADQSKLSPERWLNEHGDVLFQYAFARVRRADIAEDLVQDVLLAALRGTERFAGRASERTWLIGILKHKILDHVRMHMRQLKRAEELVEADYFFDDKGNWKISFRHWSAEPHHLMEKKEFRQVLDSCLDKLPGRLAELFLLREMDGVSTDAICEGLDISPASVWATLHRARMRLRECLTLNWFQSSSER
jgi:RNA polymerase sigma-70 factor (ECF subfamily)